MMWRMKRLVLVAFVMVLAVSCRRQDICTVVIRVPEMKNEACVERVLRAIHGVQGVEQDRTRVDRATRTVFVSYESLNLSLKNIEFAVADVGFAANSVPANAKAAESLPPECR